MRYRKFGRLDWPVSALSFGCMRLPVLDGDSGKIDEPEAIAMIRRGIDLGINYLDTAYGYHKGNSEGLVAKALADGYRERARVATKLPMWLVESESDPDKYFDEQRGRLGTDRIDVYLLHGLGPDRWETAKRLKVLQWAERRMAAGQIGHFGFSFHANLDSFRQILREYDNWAVCQIQYNYMDTEYQAGKAGLEEAAAQGLGVVVMEPLRGGTLANNPPAAVQSIWEQADQQRTPADWALQWCWRHPEVGTVLSGMSTMEHVLQNVASAERSDDGLTADELALIGRVRAAYEALAPIGCTSCEYCLPCPHGVNIPGHFAGYNGAHMYPGALERARRFYGRAEDKDKAAACVACGECLDKCPQELAIPDLLGKVHRLMSGEEEITPR